MRSLDGWARQFLEKALARPDEVQLLLLLITVIVPDDMRPVRRLVRRATGTTPGSFRALHARTYVYSV